jgi:streptogramin lyase
MRANLLALVAATLTVGACSSDFDNGYAVALTIAADPALSDAQLASIRLFNIAVSGAETANEQLTTSSAFRGTREERVLYRPQAGGGSLTFEILARDGSGGAVAYGTGNVQLKSGATVAARVVLGTNVPAQPDLLYVPPDLNTMRAPVIMPATATVKRNATVAFSADLDVVWSVREPGGGTISAAGSYTASTTFGTYTIVATRSDDPTVSSTATVTVEAEETQLLSGAPGGIGNANGNTGANSRIRGDQSAPAVDANGNLYFTDRGARTIRRADANTGAVTTIAGSYGVTGNTDGVGSAASFRDPYGIALDNAGNAYVTDYAAQVIRKIVLATGAVTTFVGAVGQSGDTDSGDPTMVRFRGPTAIAFDPTAAGGASLYVAEFDTPRIRQVMLATGATSTIANTSTCTPPAAPPTAMSGILSIAFVPGTPKRIVIADSGNSRVCVHQLGTATTNELVVSNGRLGGVTVQSNTVYYYTQPTGVLRSIPIGGGTPQVIAGTDNVLGWMDASGTAARFAGGAEGLTSFGNNAYLFDGFNRAIRKITLSTGAVTTFVGLPRRGGLANSTGNDGSTAQHKDPYAIVAHPTMPRVFVSDYTANRIRQLDVQQVGATYRATVTTIAGSPTGSSGGASATPVDGDAATFNGPHCLLLDGDTLWVCDVGNSALRAINLASPTRVTTTWPLPEQPRGLALGPGNTLYIATNQNGILTLDRTTGQTRRLFGRPDNAANPPPIAPPDLGDTDMMFTPPPPVIDGPYNTAYFWNPTGLAFDDGMKNLYVSDRDHHVVRRIELATGLVTTVVGTPGNAGSRDGTGAMALLRFPTHLVWRSGGLYITDQQNHVVRRYDPRTNVVATVAGQAGSAGVRIGVGQTGLSRPGSVAFLPTGEMVVGSEGSGNEPAEDVVVVVK